MHRNNKSKISQGKRRGKSGKRMGTALVAMQGNAPGKIPAMLPTQPTSKRFRYELIASEADTVNGSVLLSQILVATSATTTARIFAAVRIRQLEVWALGSISTTTGSGSDQSSIAVEWFGTSNSYSNSVKISDQTLGMIPAHILTRPPKGSSCSFWINQAGNLDNTSTMFTVNGPIGTVVDLVMDCVLVDNEAVSAGPVTSGMTIGTVYYNYLDGRGSGNIIPCSGVRALP